MPRPKKGSPEAKAWAEKMKKLRDSKQAPTPSQSIGDEEDLINLVKQLKSELDELKLNKPAEQQSPTFGPQGITGIYEKYIMDPAHYPNPVERLSAESFLDQFGFRQRYFLEWDIASMVPYERKDGILETQPRFTLSLHARVVDEDTGEMTSQAYKLKSLTFFEDPQTAVIIGREQGLDIRQDDEKSFLDEMRYIRMRQWLRDCFYPSKPDVRYKNDHEAVINNRLVRVYEVSSHNPLNVKEKI